MAGRVQGCAAGRLAVALGLLAAVGGPGGASGSWHPCQDSDWQIAGEDAGERALVCRGVAAAAETLAGCGVPVQGAGRVRLVDVLPVFCDSAAYGVYDLAAGEIRLGRPALCVEAGPADGLFRLLPEDDAFVALAAHEAAHALLSAGGLRGERRLEHEYIAGVVQYAALSSAARAAALGGLRVQAPDSEAEFNIALLAFAPAHYAARAWLHFNAHPDGCALLSAMAAGEVRLPDFPDL